MTQSEMSAQTEKEQQHQKIGSRVGSRSWEQSGPVKTSTPNYSSPILILSNKFVNILLLNVHWSSKWSYRWRKQYVLTKETE